MTQGHLYLKNRATGSLIVVDRASDGTVGNGVVLSAAASFGGAVAFVASATNLAPACTAGTGGPLGIRYLFRRDSRKHVHRLPRHGLRPIQQRRLLRPEAGAELGRADRRLHIGHPGNRPGVRHSTRRAARSDVFLHDRATGSMVCVTSAAVPQPIPGRGGASGAVSRSADARFLAFDSYTAGLVPDPGNGFAQIFVFDRATGRIAMVSRAANGTPGNGDSLAPRISGDGRVVAFASAASNLVPGDTNGRIDVFAAVIRPPSLAGLYVAAGNLDGSGLDEIVTGAGPGTDSYVQDVHGRRRAHLDQLPGLRPRLHRRRPRRRRRRRRRRPGRHRHRRRPRRRPPRPGLRGAAGTGARRAGQLLRLRPGLHRRRLRRRRRRQRRRLADIITGAGAGGGPHVRVFSGAATRRRQLARASSPTTPAFTGGVRVAAGDVNGDGRADIITGAGPAAARTSGSSAAPTGRALASLASFFAYDPGFTGGVYVAAGDVNGDGRPTSSPAPCRRRARTSGSSAAERRPSSPASSPTPGFTGGVRVAAGDVDGDGRRRHRHRRGPRRRAPRARLQDDRLSWDTGAADEPDLLRRPITRRP